MRNDQNPWPFDAPVTQGIFSHLKPDDLVKVKATCQFFNVNANQIAIQKLSSYGISHDIIAQFPAVTLLKHVEIFLHEIRTPIPVSLEFSADGGHPHFQPRATFSHPNFIVRPDVGVLAVCIKEESLEPCLVGTFCMVENSTICKAYQFVTSVNQNEHVEIKCLTDEKARNQLKRVMYDEQHLAILSRPTPIIMAVLKSLQAAFITKERTSFSELFARLPIFDAVFDGPNYYLKQALINMISNYQAKLSEHRLSNLVP